MFDKIREALKKSGGYEEVEIVEGDEENSRMFIGRVGDKYEIMAAVLPDKLDSPTQSLSQLSQYENVSFSDRQFKTIHSLSWDLYFNEGVIFSTINTLASLTVTPIIYLSRAIKEKRNDIFYEWLNNVNIGSKNGLIKDLTKNSFRSILYDGFVSLLVGGNWIVTDFEETVDINGDIYHIPTYIHSWDMSRVVLNPIIGGQVVAFYKPTDEEEYYIKHGKAPRGSLLDIYPKIYLRYLKRNYNPRSHFVLLTGDNTKIFRLKPDASKHVYGVPYVLAAFSPIAEKKRLQILDHAVVTGLINRILIFKIGRLRENDPYSTQSIAIATQRAKVFSKLWSSNKVMTNKLFVWSGDDIDLLDISPDSNILQFEGRFNEADDNITLSLGIPRVLLDGRSTGTQSRDVAAFTTLRGRVSVWQDYLNSYLNYIYTKYCENNEIEKTFIPFLSRSPIERTSDVYRIATKLYEDGIVGVVDVSSLYGIDATASVQHRLFEKDNNIEDLFNSPDVAFGK